MMDKRIVILFLAIVLALRFVDPIRGFISGAMTLSSPNTYTPMDPKTEWIITGWTLLAFFLGVVASADWGKKPKENPSEEESKMGLKSKTQSADEMMKRLLNKNTPEEQKQQQKTEEITPINQTETEILTLNDGSKWRMIKPPQPPPPPIDPRILEIEKLIASIKTEAIVA